MPYPHVTQFETLDRRARDRACMEASTRPRRLLPALRRRVLRPRPLRAAPCS